jgi:hypothetical protein
MAKLLIASCAQPILADPMARLDAANDQLTAINYAATTVQIAFDDFYLKLKMIKARFDSWLADHHIPKLILVILFVFKFR